MNLLNLLNKIPKMKVPNIFIAQKKQMKVLYFTTLILFLPLFAGIYYLYTQDNNKKEEIIQIETVTPIKVSLENVQTLAHAAYVVSLNNNNILYQKNSDKQLPLASITKLVTVKIAEDLLVTDKIKIYKLAEYGDSNLYQGELWNTKELIDYTLITSSNDGAHSLASTSGNFTNKMNTLMANIGATQTQFYNESGLDNDITGVPGSKGTAQDISKILSFLVKNDLSLVEKTKHDNISVSTPHGNQVATNTNEVTNEITGLILSKTGYTDLAGGNLAVVADMGLNEPTAFVVLKSSRDARFVDVLKLQNEYFKQVREGMR